MKRRTHTHPAVIWSANEPTLRTASIERLEANARVERLDSCLEKARMLQEYDEIIKEAQAFIDSGQASQAALAKMAGVTDSVLSEVLSGKYKGDVGDKVFKVAAAIAAAKARAAAPGKAQFVTTQVAQEIFAVISSVVSRDGIGLILGPSGVGKSMAAQAALSFKFPNSIYVQVNKKSRSPTALARTLMAKLGRRQGKHQWNIARAFEWICDQLRGSHRPVLIDEAENLLLDSLNDLRQIHDETGCPLILLGRPPLRSRIQDSSKDDRIGGSLVGRLCVIHDLTRRTRTVRGGGGKPLFSQEEVVEILARQKLRVARGARGWITALANIVTFGEGEGRGLRYAMNLVGMAALAYPDEELTVEILQQWNAELLDPDYAATVQHEVEQFLLAQTA